MCIRDRSAVATSACARTRSAAASAACTSWRPASAGAASASAASCRAGLRHLRLRRRPRPCCRPTPPGNLLRGPPGTASIGYGQFPLSADNATATPVVSLVRPCLSGPLRLAAVLVLVGGHVLRGFAVLG